MRGKFVLRLCGGVIVALISACGAVVQKSPVSDGPKSYRDAADLRPEEIVKLRDRAMNGDEEALFRLVRYYRSFAPRLDDCRNLLEAAYKGGNAKAGLALVDFYSLPGGEFQPNRALAIHRRLWRSHPELTLPTREWAEKCAHEYSLYDSVDGRKKYMIFQRMAALLAHPEGSE
jgi:hypothetical protein